MPKNREYELKFSVPPGAVERVVSHPLLRASLPRRRIERLVSTYFDTPDALLARHRFGLRVRRCDDGIVHTLKHSDGSSVDRGEWERADPRPRPDPAWLAQTPLSGHVTPEQLATLDERFAVEVERTSLPLKARRGAVEAALDQGAIRTGGLALHVSELELEHKGGRRKAVRALARRLVKELPLTLSLSSKSQRGYELLDLTWGRPRGKIAVRLAPHDPLALSFGRAMESALHVFLENVALIGGNDSVEAVHQSRIAMRHIRALLHLYKPVLRRKRRTTLQGEIKWFFHKLSVARDADVFQETAFAPLTRGPVVLGAEELAASMEERRKHAHAAVVSAVASTRARLLFLAMLEFAMSGVRRRHRRRPTRRFLRRALAQLRRSLTRRARRLARQSPMRQHEVRKSAKTLRYALDLSAGAKVGAERSRKRRKRLKILQQALGTVHDEVALRRYLRAKVLHGDTSFARERSGRGHLAAAHLAERPMSHRRLLAEAQKAADGL